MNQWLNDLKRLIKLVGIICLVLLSMFVLNQFLLLYQMISRWHPVVALIVTIIILIGFIYLIVQVYRTFKANELLPEMPTSSNPYHYLEYLTQLKAILDKNPNISHLNIEEEVHIRLIEFDHESILQLSESALSKNITEYETVINHYLNHLNELSKSIIIENANAIFISTTISQNGSLDSLMVLYTQIRVIWLLARLYQTRPSLSSLMKLYGQVMAAVLTARTMEDMDLIEAQIEPLIASLVGESMASAIPGMIPVTNMIVSSLIDGSLNTLLTLRIGYITQDYLGMYALQTSQSIRRSATVRSLQDITQIVNDNGKQIIKTMGSAIKNASVSSAKRWFKFGN